MSGRPILATSDHLLTKMNKTNLYISVLYKHVSFPILKEHGRTFFYGLTTVHDEVREKEIEGRGDLQGD
jgi:hypothetical protein